MIFSWIDTIGDNFPPPIDAHLVRFLLLVDVGISTHIVTSGVIWAILYLKQFISVSFAKIEQLKQVEGPNVFYSIQVSNFRIVVITYNFCSYNVYKT